MTHQPLPYQSAPTPAARDIDHLNLLAIFHYVWGGLVLLFSCFGIIYILMGVAFVNNPAAFAPPGGTGGRPPPIGWFFIGMGSFFLLLGWIVGGLNLYSARCMQRREKRVLSLVVGGLNCISFPIGTTLGIFTFIVMLRDSVTQLYKYGQTNIAPSSF